MKKAKPEKPVKLDSQTPKNQNPSRKLSVSSKKSMSRKRSAMALIDEQKKPEWEKLKTGLQMYINKETIIKWWQSDKIKQTIIDYITKFFDQMQILRNFESMDIAILAEFHVFNIIFAKEELYLDDTKTTVLINLLWTLLISNNEDYGEMATIQNDLQAQDLDFVQKSDQAEDEFLYQEQLQKQEQTQNSQASPKNTIKDFNQQDPNSQNNKNKKMPHLKRRKTRETDMAAFIFWLKKHSINQGMGTSQKYFEPSQVSKIVEFVKKSYFLNYNLYKYSLINKKANEEIRYTLTIDEPMSIPPLSEALFMGQKKFIIDEDDDNKKEEQNEQNNENEVSQVQSTIQDQEQQNLETEHLETEQQEENQTQNLQQQQLQNQISVDPQTQQIREIADENLNPVKNKFSETLQARDLQLQEQIDDILNPKKKK